MSEKKSRRKPASKADAPPLADALPPTDAPPSPTKQQCEGWLAEIRTLYGKSIHARLAVARRFKEIRDQIGRHFEDFIKSHVEPSTGLGWSKSQVYRMIAAYDTWDGNEYLDRFDLSALYSLSPRWPNRGEPTQQQKDKAEKVEKARQKCIEKAKKGQFITNKIALQALEKFGARNTRNASVRRPSITATVVEWNATAKKRKLDPEKVRAMLTDLGFTVSLTDAPAKDGDEAA